VRYQYDRAMTPEELLQWRNDVLNTSQAEAAALLGLSTYTLCRMEKGTQVIPRPIALLVAFLRYRNLREIAAQWHTDHPKGDK
jgi:DNA-binding XRE family transcriptional regulator